MATLIQKHDIPVGKRHPEWCYNAVIYELNVRQFSAAGDFMGVIAQIPRLAALGVDVIWLMPIFPIGELERKGGLGSYYSIRDYRAVNPEFGTMGDFDALIVAAHAAGVRVVLDWVANHTSRDAVWVGAHRDWYVADDKGGIVAPFDWSDTAQLDYSNSAMRDEMIQSLKFWVTERNIDGFRMDMAMLMPMDFWDQVSGVLAGLRGGMGDELFMLAEAEGSQFQATTFDATYGWKMHHAMVDVAAGRAAVGSLVDILLRNAVEFAPRDMEMNFTSNHDENSWNGSEFTRFGEALRNMAMLTFVLPGIPMIYNGQEMGVDQPLDFFDRDPILWHHFLSCSDCAANSRLYSSLYGELISLRHKLPALRGGERGGDLYLMDCDRAGQVLAVKRVLGDSVVIALLNMSDSEVEVVVADDHFRGSYHQVGSDAVAELVPGRPFYLGPWGGFVYFK